MVYTSDQHQIWKLYAYFSAFASFLTENPLHLTCEKPPDGVSDVIRVHELGRKHIASLQNTQEITHWSYLCFILCVFKTPDNLLLEQLPLFGAYHTESTTIPMEIARDYSSLHHKIRLSNDTLDPVEDGVFRSA